MAKNSEAAIGAYMAIGAGVGSALGVALDSIPMGLALGAAVGVFIGLLVMNRSKAQKLADLQSKDEKNEDT